MLVCVKIYVLHNTQLIPLIVSINPTNCNRFVLYYSLLLQKQMNTKLISVIQIIFTLILLIIFHIQLFSAQSLLPATIALTSDTYLVPNNVTQIAIGMLI